VGDRSEADLSVLLTDFAYDLADNGKWDDTQTQTTLADWAQSANLSQIRNNILGWKIAETVPDFENLLRDFWAQNYGLGACVDGNNLEVKQVANAESRNDKAYFICSSGLWRLATEYEYDTFGWGACETEGNLKDGVVSSKKYVCEDKVWRVASAVEAVLGGCTEKRASEVTEASGIYYFCESKVWRAATDFE
jgi:hypothetical protein